MTTEKILNEDSFLVSETNKQGLITFANDDFCKISGYSLEELIGQPHNIVKHEDMPKVAFKELWDTVNSGKIWSGYVKNKIKGGKGFYWVFATVYPFQTCDGEIGFLSCRRKPAREEIEEYEKIYKDLKIKELNKY